MNTSLKWMALAGLAWFTCGRTSAGEFVERPAIPAQEPHRFLFVVETSSSNRKFENANRQAVFDLIVGGVNGQMRSGDTYGIWIFNDEVKAGEFPVAVWERDQSLDLAGQAAAFLQKQRYVKRTIIQLLVDELRRLSDRVGDFNVFIISSGDDPIAGTPFDQNINSAYRSMAKQSSRTGRPFVTSFVVRKGRPVRSGVVLAGDRIVLPERPPEAPAPKRPPVVPNATAAISASSNSLVTAESTQPSPRKKVIQFVAKSNTPSATPTVVASSLSTNATNFASTVGVAQPEATSNPVAETPPPVQLANLTSAASVPDAAAAPTPGPTPTPPPPPASTPAPASVSVVAPSPVIQPEVKERPVAPEVEPVPKVVAAATTASLSPLSLVPNGAPPTPAPAFAVTQVTGAATSAPQPALAASAVVVMAREPSGSSSANSELPLLQGAVVLVRTVDGLSAGVLLAIGGTLLGAACFLLYALFRRPPVDAKGSLITQAMRPGRRV